MILIPRLKMAMTDLKPAFGWIVIGFAFSILKRVFIDDCRNDSLGSFTFVAASRALVIIYSSGGRTFSTCVAKTVLIC